MKQDKPKQDLVLQILGTHEMSWVNIHDQTAINPEKLDVALNELLEKGRIKETDKGYALAGR